MRISLSSRLDRKQRSLEIENPELVDASGEIQYKYEKQFVVNNKLYAERPKVRVHTLIKETSTHTHAKFISLTQPRYLMK